MTSKLDRFIKNQSQKVFSENNHELEKEWWLHKLAELYEFVRYSLEDYVNNGDVSITGFPVILLEEQLGSYEAEQLEILIGRQVVRLKPIGTFLIGARGRVDMVGPRGSARLVVVPPALQKPSVEITMSSEEDATKPSTESKHASLEEWTWKISTLPPRIMYLELNSESFQEVLMAVVNGDS